MEHNKTVAKTLVLPPTPSVHKIIKKQKAKPVVGTVCNLETLSRNRKNTGPSNESNTVPTLQPPPDVPLHVYIIPNRSKDYNNNNNNQSNHNDNVNQHMAETRKQEYQVRGTLWVDNFRPEFFQKLIPKKRDHMYDELLYHHMHKLFTMAYAAAKDGKYECSFRTPCYTTGYDRYDTDQLFQDIVEQLAEWNFEVDVHSFDDHQAVFRWSPISDEDDVENNEVDDNDHYLIGDDDNDIGNKTTKNDKVSFVSL